MSWFNTVEFYVIAGTVAAAAVALAALPQRRGPVVQHFAAGELLYDGLPASPQLEVWVDDWRHVHLLRRALPNVGNCGAASLAISVSGFDVTIEERITFDRRSTAAVDTAHYTLDFLAPERYHICFRSQATGTMCAFTLPVREGISLTKPLS